ncbi:MAG: glycosyltransferase family 4 protein [Deltaproteobacteria bacterium]|nr:glycosyltransferase family 4 protein [Deltaproteobacteria bacterium]
MGKRVDILVVGMDKITDKSGYLYDAFTERGIRCLLYSRDKIGMANKIKHRLKVDIKIVPKSIVLEIVYFLSVIVFHRPKHVEMYHTHLIAQPLYVLACFICRVPLVVWCIGELYQWEKFHPLRKIVNRFAYRVADVLILTELYMEETVEKYRLTDKAKCVFCSNRIPVKEDSSVERKGKVVLFLNSFKPWRRLELLIDAVPAILEEVPESRFLLVGSAKHLNYLKRYMNMPQYEKMLESKIRDAGISSCVEIRPFTENPWEYYEQASIFVLPADIVFCNYSLLEAMERGMPPVVASVEGARLIVDDGIDGFVVQQNPQAVADAVIRLLSDDGLREKMGRKAREKIVSKFSIQISVGILLDAYKSHIKGWKNHHLSRPHVFAS